MDSRSEVVNYGFEWLVAWCHAGCLLLSLWWNFPQQFSSHFCWWCSLVTWNLLRNVSNMKRCKASRYKISLLAFLNFSCSLISSSSSSSGWRRERDLMNGEAAQQLATKNVNFSVDYLRLEVVKKEIQSSLPRWYVMEWMKTASLIVFGTDTTLSQLQNA